MDNGRLAKTILLWIFNFFGIAGGALMFRKRTFQCYAYALTFFTLMSLASIIGHEWALFTLIFPQVHFWKVRRPDMIAIISKREKLLAWLATAVVMCAYLIRFGPGFTDHGTIKYPKSLFLLAEMAILIPTWVFTNWSNPKRTYSLDPRSAQ